MTVTSCPPTASRPASSAPTRPQPTMMVRISEVASLSGRSRVRVPAWPAVLRCSLAATGSRMTITVQGAFWKTYGIVLPDGEVAAEPLAIWQAEQHHVRIQLDGLVHERRADVACLEQFGPHLHRYFSAIPSAMSRTADASSRLPAISSSRS